MAEVERADNGATEGARAVLDDLNHRWHPLRDRLEALLDGGVEAFNEAVREAGIEPVERGRGGG